MSLVNMSGDVIVTRFCCAMAGKVLGGADGRGIKCFVWRCVRQPQQQAFRDLRVYGKCSQRTIQGREEKRCRPQARLCARGEPPSPYVRVLPCTPGGMTNVPMTGKPAFVRRCLRGDRSSAHHRKSTTAIASGDCQQSVMMGFLTHARPRRRCSPCAPGRANRFLTPPYTQDKVSLRAFTRAALSRRTIHAHGRRAVAPASAGREGLTFDHPPHEGARPKATWAHESARRRERRCPAARQAHGTAQPSAARLGKQASPYDHTTAGPLHSCEAQAAIRCPCPPCDVPETHAPTLNHELRHPTPPTHPLRVT